MSVSRLGIKECLVSSFCYITSERTDSYFELGIRHLIKTRWLFSSSQKNKIVFPPLFSTFTSMFSPRVGNSLFRSFALRSFTLIDLLKKSDCERVSQVAHDKNRREQFDLFQKQIALSNTKNERFCTKKRWSNSRPCFNPLKSMVTYIHTFI